MADADAPAHSVGRARNFGTRRLTERELATVRAALRLWLELPAAAIPPSVYVELHGTAALDDAEIERLIEELV